MEELENNVITGLSYVPQFYKRALMIKYPSSVGLDQKSRLRKPPSKHDPCGYSKAKYNIPANDFIGTKMYN